MKKLAAFFLLLPLMAIGQEDAGNPVMTNIMLTPHPAHITQLEAGLKEHNATFHSQGAAGARVYWIMNGENSDKYVWVMGPHTWSTMDEMEMGGEHWAHWNNKVLAHTTGAVTNVFRFHPEHSNFSQDFDLNYLSVFIVDMARFQDPLFMSVVERVKKVYAEKMPDQQYGIYMNAMPGKDGYDFAWVDFFDKMAWMGKEDNFPKYFEEVHGAGSFSSFLADVEKSTEGEMAEIWMYRSDLSGLDGKVVALERQ